MITNRAFELGPSIKSTAFLVRARHKVADGYIRAAEADSVALEARCRIDKVIAADSYFDGMDVQERYHARGKHLRILMERSFTWA